jgi:excisionase family DNA binding protein
VARTYTIREAAELTTKSYSALRGMVDRGQLETVGGGKPGRTRRITHDELKRAGILRTEEVLAESAVQELSLRLRDLGAELRDVEARLSQQIGRVEALLTKQQEPGSDSSEVTGEPGLRAAA